jgi:hypothetical protein
LPIIVNGGKHRVNEEVDVQIDGWAGGCLTGAAICPEELETEARLGP